MSAMSSLKSFQLNKPIARQEAASRSDAMMVAVGFQPTGWVNLKPFRHGVTSENSIVAPRRNITIRTVRGLKVHGYHHGITT